jgi:hypothetical protein
VIATISTIDAFLAAENALGAATFDLIRTRFAVSNLDAEIEETKRNLQWNVTFQAQMQANLEAAVQRGDRKSIATLQRARDAALPLSNQEVNRLSQVLEKQIDRRLPLIHALIEKSIQHWTTFSH